MHPPSLKLCVSSFRNRVLVWALIIAISSSFFISVSLAQTPTATISSLQGTVLVNGQEQAEGIILNAGDVIETQAGTTVVLELSDGSVVEVGENTQVSLTQLTQTASGARISQLKLLWGRIRATLSPGHQQTGSSFEIETPNALIGVTFSQPDIEVSYSRENAETIGIAHTVELLAKNLMTNEEVLVPVGATVIIVGTTVKIVAGILAIADTTETGTAEAATTGTETTSSGTPSTGSSGMGAGTKVAIGVGAAAVVGGIFAVANSGNEDQGGADNNIDWQNPFTGTFRMEFTQQRGCTFNGVESECLVTEVNLLSLTQTGISVTGTVVETDSAENCCTVTSQARPITGVVNGTTLTFMSSGDTLACQGSNCSYINEFEGGTATFVLLDNGNLRFEEIGEDVIRQ